MRTENMCADLRHEVLKELLGDIRLSAIVAMDEAGGIGKNGEIPWRLPSDMRHFAEYTTDKSLIMGRRTAESLPSGMLGRGRYLHVLTGDVNFLPGAEAFILDSWTYPSVPFLLSTLQRNLLSRRHTEAVLCGGRSVYSLELLSLCDEIVITRVPGNYGCDVIAPHYLQFPDYLGLGLNAGLELQGTKDIQGATVEYWRT